MVDCGDYKQSEYGRVILPLVVLRRLDCVLEPTKAQVLGRLATLGGRVENVGPILESITGIEVYSAEVSRITGSDDHRVVTPSNTVLRVAGSGDFWSSEWSMTYPDRQDYRVVDLIELRDGPVYRETVYWAAPFEAPAWRRPFVGYHARAD